MANEKILVVDDDANICELLRLYLTKEGYQVTTAGDGEEGLERSEERRVGKECRSRCAAASARRAIPR